MEKRGKIKMPEKSGKRKTDFYKRNYFALCHKVSLVLVGECRWMGNFFTSGAAHMQPIEESFVCRPVFCETTSTLLELYCVWVLSTMFENY